MLFRFESATAQVCSVGVRLVGDIASGGREMACRVVLASVLTACLVSVASAQQYTGLRINGPDSIAELGTYLYTATAEFDNGWEFEVTLDATFSLEPGLHASIGPYGDLRTHEVSLDQSETLHAEYTLGEVTHEAVLTIAITDAKHFIVDHVRPGSRMLLTPYCDFPAEVTNGLRSFERDGTPAGVFLPDQVHRAEGCPVFDFAGNLIISQWNRDELLVVSPSGELVRVISGGGLDGPTATAIDPNGTIAVGSYLNSSMKFYSPLGEYLGEFGHPGTQHPQCLAYDRQGHLYVGIRGNGYTQRITVFDQDHVFLREFGEDIFEENVRAMAFDREENLWTVDEYHELYKFDRSGTLLQTLNHPDLQPLGLAIDEHGNLFVTNGSSFEVFVFSPEGELLERVPVDFGEDPDPSLRLLGIAFRPMHAAPDYNEDGAVDLVDFDVFSLCMFGPDVTPPFAECTDIFDLDWDGDVDVIDFAEFMFFHSGQ
jgi:hypothetical protein